MEKQKAPAQILICFLVLLFISCVFGQKTDPGTVERGTWAVEEEIRIHYFATKTE